ncbi:MAG: hypothetical protein ABSB26_03525 [Nitrososphaerales archaeon]|jgi:hypothetical protein
MNKGKLLMGVALAFLFVLPATALASKAPTTYTYLEFNCNPQSPDGTNCTAPLNGVTEIILTTTVSSTVPSGTVNWYCYNGEWNTKMDGSGVDGGSCATLPYIPPGPACASTKGFLNYEVTQITVYTPNDPSASDVYMLGTTSHSGITSQPIVVGPSQTLTVPFGPETSPLVIGSNSYEWYRIRFNGAVTGGSIITHPTPSPTGIAGTYLIDIEGQMTCGTATSPVTQLLHFDVGYTVTTPEFGSMFLAVGFSALALVLLKKRVAAPHIA